MDRRKEGVSKSQYEFLVRIVVPMFEVWVSAFPAAKPILTNTMANVQQWDSLRPAAEQSHRGSFKLREQFALAKWKSSLKDTDLP